MDFNILNDYLNQQAHEVLQDIVPGGILKGSEYIAASKLGGKGDSFKYNIKKMRGSDFATDEKFGDLISLNASVNNIKQIESAKELAARYCPQLLQPEVTKDKDQPTMRHNKYGNPIKTWCYRKPDGSPIFYIARYHDKHGKKYYLPYTYVNTRWEQKAPVKPRPLYNIPELVKNTDKPVLLVEGEKAADVAHRLLSDHFTCTTWPNGASAINAADWKLLYGRHIVMWPDADKAGKDAAQAIGKLLKGHCKSFNVVKTDGFPKGFDIADFTGEALEYICKNQEPLQEPDEPIVSGRDVEVTLEYANNICKDNVLAYEEISDTIYNYDEGYYKPIKHGKKNSKVDRLIIQCDGGEGLSVAQRGNVIKNVQTLSYVDEDHFNNDYINFKNCLFDPLNGIVLDHTPNVYSVNRIPYNYDKDAKSPLWEDFLNTVLEKDENKIKILQEFIGYCFLKTCKYEKALFLPGGGQNGKGTFTSVIVHLFGGKTNVSAANIEQLADDVRRSAILNKYVNIDTEVPKRAERYESAFKQAVSGEEMLFNEKYIAPYSKAPHCKLIFSANKIPRIDEGTMGFYRRLIIIPFNKKIEDHEKDVDLKHRLATELPGVFNWAMIGLKRLQEQNGFTHDQDAVDIVEELRKDNNIILQFADDILQVHKNMTFGVTKSNLYLEYKAWCEQYGHKKLSYRNFNKEFYEEFKDITEKDKNNSKLPTRDRFWPGISRLNSGMIGEKY